MTNFGEIKTAKELGYKGNDKRVWTPCEICGKGRWVTLVRGIPSRQKCFDCWAKSYRGAGNPFWKGGRYKNNGWIKVRMPEHHNADRWGYVLEHRLVMERKLGRLLTTKEIVHHLNGIKDDNRPENLMLADSRHNPSTLLKPYKDRIKELELAIDKLIDAEIK